MFAFLKARAKEKQLREYSYDLIWLLAKSKYDPFPAPMPSEVNRKKMTEDRRTGQQIKDDLVKQLSAQMG